MKRRYFCSAVVTAGIAGCLNTTPSSEPPTTDSESSITGLKNSEYVWRHEIPGDSMTVSGGRVFGDEKVPRTDQHGLDISGGVFSLDVQTGEHHWTYGSSDESMSGYRTPIVKDAVYVEKQNDVTSWPCAIELDGTERWSSSEGTEGPLSGKLSHVTNGLVYLVDGSELRAIDAVTGEQVWAAQGSSAELDTAVSDGHETIYVGGDEFIARNTDDGSVQWRYEHSGEQSDVEFVSDGIAYATVDREHVIAVADGELLQQTDSLFQAYVHAFNATGQQWSQEMTGRICVHNDRVYVGKSGSPGKLSTVSAFALNDGTEVWSIELGEEDDYSPLQIEAIGKENGTTEPSLFVKIGRNKLHRINRAGDVTQTWTAESWLHDCIVDELLIISADSGIYALKP